MMKCVADVQTWALRRLMWKGLKRGERGAKFKCDWAPELNMKQPIIDSLFTETRSLEPGAWGYPTCAFRVGDLNRSLAGSRARHCPESTAQNRTVAHKDAPLRRACSLALRQPIWVKIIEFIQKKNVMQSSRVVIRKKAEESNWNQSIGFVKMLHDDSLLVSWTWSTIWQGHETTNAKRSALQLVIHPTRGVVTIT